jgi:hypothetical protein
MSLKVRANEISNWTNVDKDVLTGDNGPSNTFDISVVWYRTILKERIRKGHKREIISNKQVEKNEEGTLTGRVTEHHTALVWKL